VCEGVDASGDTIDNAQLFVNFQLNPINISNAADQNALRTILHDPAQVTQKNTFLP
jgi:hypothetical protein